MIRGKQLESWAMRRVVLPRTESVSDAGWQGGRSRIAAAYHEGVIHH